VAIPAEHERKCERVSRQLAEIVAAGSAVRLGKTTSNLFRDRGRTRGPLLEAGDLGGVLAVDAKSLTAEVEGMAPYDALVRETLRHGLLPAVTPQLKSITVGGAVGGVGIESSSFRYGLVHETVEEMEILSGDGRRVVCSRRDNADLFFGFPNSYGTLGYALRLRIRLIPARRFVHLRHAHFDRAAAFFEAIEAAASDPATDFLDGTVFGADEMYMTTGAFTDAAPRTSDYRWMKIYYRSLRHRAEDWLTARDYIWRWDTDWFWCSKNLYAQYWPVRLAATPLALNSRTYQRVMRLARRWKPDRGGAESVIQDVDIPVGRAEEFLRFLLSEVGIVPVWICPFRAADAEARFDLYSFDPQTLYINFGFWDVIPSAYEPGHYNRRVERKLVELGGKKGLYSSVYFDEDTFWALYNRPAYERLKAKYDPRGVLPGLYEKCVRP
jgi:FAD/FMN-containing dehydrogenase